MVNRAMRTLLWTALAGASLLAAGCASSGSASGTGAGNSGSGGQGATVPTVPAGVVATAGNAQVGLSWSASSGATSYVVKRGTVSGGPYTQMGTPTTTSYTDNAVANGTKYFYVEEASDSAGVSANSAEVSATPVAPVTAPAAPTGVVATAGNAQVALSWSASTGATGYVVKRGTARGGPYTQIATPKAVTF